MKSKFLLLLVFFIVGSTVMTCGTCDPVPLHFEILGIESYNLRFTNAESRPSEFIEENESVIWSKFFVRFEFTANYIALSRDRFGGALLATSCSEPGESGDKIGVDTIVVRTVYDYNDDYPAGAVINNIVLINDWTFWNTDFDEFLQLDDYIIENSQGVRRNSFELKLTEKPATNRTFSFDITYRLNNGDVFKHLTEDANLTW